MSSTSIAFIPAKTPGIFLITTTSLQTRRQINNQISSHSTSRQVNSHFVNTTYDRTLNRPDKTKSTTATQTNGILYTASKRTYYQVQLYFSTTHSLTAYPTTGSCQRFYNILNTNKTPREPTTDR